MPLLSFFRPRYSLRALLVVMTLLALFFWYHINWIKQRRALLDSGEIVSTSDLSVRAPLILALFGESGQHEIGTFVPTEAQVQETERRIASLFPEAEVYVDVACPPESFLDSDEVLP